MKKLLFITLLCTIIFNIYAKPLGNKYDFKKLQGPPDEFDIYIIPNSSESSITTSSAYLPIIFDDQGYYDTDFYVDSSTEFSFCTLSPLEEEFIFGFVLPGSPSTFTLSQLLAKFDSASFVQYLAIGNAAIYSSNCYTFFNPIVGSWSVSLSVVQSGSNFNLTGIPVLYPLGYFIVHNESPYKIVAYNSNNGIIGNDIQLIAKVVNQDGDVVKLTPKSNGKGFPGKKNFQDMSEAVVVDPTGQSITVTMKDDGMSGDFLADDGIFGGVLKLQEEGSYRVSTFIDAINPDGDEFQRSVEQVFGVVKKGISLHQNVKGKIEDNYLKISIRFEKNLTDEELADSENKEYIAYSQVWGTDNATNTNIPVAWVSGLVQSEKVSSFDNVHEIKLDLNLDWITISGAVAPFFLRNVRVQDKGIMVVLDQLEDVVIDVKQSEFPTDMYVDDVSAIQITEEMRNGPRPEKYSKSKRSSNGTSTGKKLLVHGYCSDAKAWPVEDFTDYALFQDPNANRKVDEFARLVMEFASNQGIDSYSIIAHSQGGQASLHIATYYWSGLDVATGGNLIQSMGTPYLGTALAGGLAGLGGIFGIGCGANEGLTKEGAAAWFAGIPKEKQQIVHYYTTQGTDSCSSVANWLGLDAPNDGVTSTDFAMVEFGVYEGDSTGWCHTVDMTSPYQNTDHPRNAILNQNAAL